MFLFAAAEALRWEKQRANKSSKQILITLNEFDVKHEYYYTTFVLQTRVLGAYLRLQLNVSRSTLNAKVNRTAVGSETEMERKRPVGTAH